MSALASDMPQKMNWCICDANLTTNVQQRQSRSPIPCNSAKRGEGRRRQAPKLYRPAMREHYEMLKYTANP